MTRLYTRVLVPVLLLSAAVSLSRADSPDAALPDFRHQPVWCGLEHACFLSGSLLETTAIEDLPLSESLKATLLYRLQNSPFPPDPLRRWANQSGCSDPVETSPPAGSHSQAANLEKLLRKQQTVTLGAVVDVIPGWSPRRSSAGELIEIEIVEVLRDRTNALRQGERLAYFNPGGEFYYRGRRVCTSRAESFHLPQAGDLLLVAAALPPGDSSFLYKRLVFPVVSGQVLPQPYTLLADQQPRALEEIRRFFSALR